MSVLFSFTLDNWIRTERGRFIKGAENKSLSNLSSLVLYTITWQASGAICAADLYLSKTGYGIPDGSTYIVLYHENYGVQERQKTPLVSHTSLHATLFPRIITFCRYKAVGFTHPAGAPPTWRERLHEHLSSWYMIGMESGTSAIRCISKTKRPWRKLWNIWKMYINSHPGEKAPFPHKY